MSTSLPTKRPQKDGIEKIVRSRTKFVNDLIEQTAKLLPTEITSELVAIYTQQLLDLSESAIQAAFERSLRGCLFFPKIAELRNFAEDYRRELAVRQHEQERVQRIAQPVKPYDWPEDPEERQRFIDECKERSGILIESVAEVAKAKEIPSLRERLNTLTAKRNGSTKVPSDPAARKIWAHDQAIKMGWADQREPGAEG